MSRTSVLTISELFRDLEMQILMMLNDSEMVILPSPNSEDKMNSELTKTRNLIEKEISEDSTLLNVIAAEAENNDMSTEANLNIAVLYHLLEKSWDRLDTCDKIAIIQAAKDSIKEEYTELYEDWFGED